jgi:hypothetical protein
VILLSDQWNLLGGRSGAAGGGKWTERLVVPFQWLAALGHIPNLFNRERGTLGFVGK